jgi:hypothetical protein
MSKALVKNSLWKEILMRNTKTNMNMCKGKIEGKCCQRRI